MPSKNILPNFPDITKKLDELDEDREELIRISRKMVRNCSIAIKSIHRKKFEDYSSKIEEIKKDHQTLLKIVDRNPMTFGKYLKTAEQEYIEAVCLYAIITEKEIPSHEACNVDIVNYLLGLADVVGELRRFILDKIRSEEMDEINKILEDMESLYSYLFSLDYPKGLTHDLRRKTDVARSIIERTRGDITLSLQINKLHKDLEKK